MYLNYYGLYKEPFHITPDPEFLFESPSHKEAYATIVYGVEQRKGFIAVTGEVGTGKTTIIRAYLKTLDRANLRPVYVFNPDLGFDELLRFLIHELGAENKEGSTAEQLQTLHWRLIELYKEGQGILLVIDEAQNMPVETIEKLRMLSNLETTQDKLLQIVLVGQPELDDKLNLHQLRQLRQRIAVRANLRALSDAESAQYVEHRIECAGGRFAGIFSSGALRAILRHSKGSPRTLNILCDNVLLAGFGAQQKPISARLVREVILDLSGKRRSRRPVRWAPAALIAGVLLVALGASFPLGLWRGANVDAADSGARIARNGGGVGDGRVAAQLAHTPELVRAEASVAPEPKPISHEAAAVAPAPKSDAVSPIAPLPHAAEAMAPKPVETNAALANAMPAPSQVEAKDVLKQDVKGTAAPAKAVEPEAKIKVAALPKRDASPVKHEAKKDAVEPAKKQTPAAPARDATPIKAATLASVLNAPVQENTPIKVAKVAPVVSTPTAEPAPKETATSAAPKPEPSKQPVPPVWAFSQEHQAAADAVYIEPAAKEKSPAPNSGQILLVVRQGATLSGLVREVYGACNETLLHNVEVCNPFITDRNMILTGQKLAFPRIAGYTHDLAAAEAAGNATPGSSTL